MVGIWSHVGARWNCLFCVDAVGASPTRVNVNNVVSVVVTCSARGWALGTIEDFFISVIYFLCLLSFWRSGLEKGARLKNRT
jgi:hypothetical protein